MNTDELTVWVVHNYSTQIHGSGKPLDTKVFFAPKGTTKRAVSKVVEDLPSDPYADWSEPRKVNPVNLVLSDEVVLKVK